ncbi:MAG TPA: lipopolysaccharide biosynthesis protein RfbH, partial [Ktedonobacterales bacterium]|nr:lipopolysaccharide biosynthesis protein RfbH [Ktedonobacterales bacterium]
PEIEWVDDTLAQHGIAVRHQRVHLLPVAVVATASVVGTVSATALARVLRDRVHRETSRFYDVFHAPKPFAPGQTYLPYAARVFDEREVQAAVDASLDFWLTLGDHGEQFQRGLARFVGARASVLMNSGSSANLVAFSALTSPKLGSRRLRPGDEVITVAAGFPTTVNPIIQAGCVPVFIDCDPRTANARVDQLEEALSPRTRAVMMAHTLGNPFDVDAVLNFCRRHRLWLIEDNCDALGSLYKGRLTGSFGDLSTQSFYPPHHLTMGEGGAVNVVRSALLKKIVESYRDWGRDCWCDSGKENTCAKRFEWELGALPKSYDHKYIYSHIGYNLKPLDIQAAIGERQLEKLPSFVAARRRNWERLYAGIAPFEEFVELPQATPGAEPSWFGFLLLVRPEAPFTRRDIVAHIEERRIQTRMLFGGNLTRQPAYLSADAHGDHPLFRAVGDLAGADRMMNDAFFLGVYPGLTDAHIEYMVATVGDFFKRL